MNYKVGSLAALISKQKVSECEGKNIKICEIEQNEKEKKSATVNSLSTKNTNDLKRKRTEESNRSNKISPKKKKLLQNEELSISEVNEKTATDDNTVLEKESKIDTKKVSTKVKKKKTSLNEDVRKSETSEIQSKTDNTDEISSNLKNDSNIDERTIFIGNWPIKKSKKSLKNLFSRYGNIESIRFRSVPIANFSMPKKVLAIKKQFHPDRTSTNAYIKFHDKNAALKALEANGTIVDDHHLRITLSNQTSNYDYKKSIFIGNIDFKAEEEDVWKIFSKCGEIESVRLIRDNKTGVSRGIGYVNFKKSDGVELALRLTDVDINGRVLRIKRIQKSMLKHQNKNLKSDTQNLKTGDLSKIVKKPKKKDYQGIKFTEKNKKKKQKKKGNKKSIIKKKQKIVTKQFL